MHIVPVYINNVGYLLKRTIWNISTTKDSPRGIHAANLLFNVEVVFTAKLNWNVTLHVHVTPHLLRKRLNVCRSKLFFPFSSDASVRAEANLFHVIFDNFFLRANVTMTLKYKQQHTCMSVKIMRLIFAVVKSNYYLCVCMCKLRRPYSNKNTTSTEKLFILLCRLRNFNWKRSLPIYSQPPT